MGARRLRPLQTPPRPAASQLPAAEVQALDVLDIGILRPVKDGLLDDVGRPPGRRGEDSQHSKPTPAPILPPSMEGCHGGKGQRGWDVGVVVGRGCPQRWWYGVGLWWDPHSVVLQLNVLGLGVRTLHTAVLADEHCQAVHLGDKKEKKRRKKDAVV